MAIKQVRYCEDLWDMAWWWQWRMDRLEGGLGEERMSFLFFLNGLKWMNLQGVGMPYKVCGYYEPFHSEPSGMGRDVK
jgi:hypothetical protein